MSDNKIPHIVLATPFRHRRNPHLTGFNSIDKTIRRITIDRIETYGMYVDDARNQLVKDFLERTKDRDDCWIFFVDDDVLLPMDTFDIFLETIKENPDKKFFYGDYALKRRGYESAHVYDQDGSVRTVATGLMFVHKSVFVELFDKGVTFGKFLEPPVTYRWFVCEGYDKKAGEDHYFTRLCLKIDVIPHKIETLIGVHCDFSQRAAFGPDYLIRNGKIRYDKAWIYAIEKETNPFYFNLVEHEIEVNKHTFPETKAHANIAVCTPRRYKHTPVLTNLNLNPLRNTYNIDMYGVSEMPRDVARNQLVQKALDDGNDWILFIDDDTILHFDAIQDLMSYNEPIIGFNYSLKKPYYESAHLMEEPTEIFNKVRQFPIPAEAKGLVNVTRVIGMGATLIKKEVFENINYPWFQEQSLEACGKEYKDLENDKKISYTDDAYFTRLAVKAGYCPKVVADKHAGHVCFNNFTVYGHPNIVNNRTGKLRLRKDIKWALSKEYETELLEKENCGLTPDEIEEILTRT